MIRKCLVYLVIIIFFILSPIVNATKEVTIVYDPSADPRLDAGMEIRKVSIAGTFNNWDKDADVMEKLSDGRYLKKLWLDDGLYYYKIVVNDNIWLEDLNADSALRQNDGMGKGEFNSGLLVKETGADYGEVKTMSINMNAVKHDFSEVLYYRVLSAGEVKIMLRTLKKDVDKVEIVYKDGNIERRREMKRAISRDGFDFYKILLKLSSSEPYFSYYFVLYDGSFVRKYLNNENKMFRGFTGVIRDVPDWAQDVVWYQIFPERFRNGDKTNDPRVDDLKEGDIPGWAIKNWGSDWYSMDEWEKKNYGTFFSSVFRRRYGGDLQGIIDKLDYLKELGIGAIYLNPIFRAPSLHKYDASCFHHVDETFGPDPAGDRRLLAEANETEDPATWVWTAADKLFLKLIKEAHSRGIRIIIDGVFNHSGRTFFAFQDILKNGQKSRYKGWYEITKWDTALPDGFDYKGWFGNKTLPEFYRDENGFNEEYKNYLFNITKRWMAPEGVVSNGVDGWRLDVAFCVPHIFWKEWRQVVKRINPDAYITGEVVDIAPEYLQGDEFDALMNYPFAYIVSEFFIDRKNKITVTEFDRRLSELRSAYPIVMTYVMQNLLSSHDTPRLASMIVNPDMNYRDFGRFYSETKLQNNPLYRVDRGTAEDLKIHKLIVIFQMTYVGAPMIYYGNEVNMTGANDPDCRKPMLWDDIKYDDEVVHPIPGFQRIREKNEPNRELFEHYKKMIKIRNENIALRRGNFITLYTDDKQGIYAFLREHPEQRILVVLNNGNADQTVEINIDENPAGKKWKDLLNEKIGYYLEGRALKVHVRSKCALILKEDKEYD